LVVKIWGGSVSGTVALKSRADGLYEQNLHSKSEVSRRFKIELKKVMDEVFNQRLDESYYAIMVDGMERGGITIGAALSITDDGRK